MKCSFPKVTITYIIKCDLDNDFMEHVNLCHLYLFYSCQGRSVYKANINIFTVSKFISN